MSDYPKFKPIPRLNRRVTITEKINGTNGLIEITKASNWSAVDPSETASVFEVVGPDGEFYRVRAGSRNRWLTPSNDNFGFALWVFDHAATLTGLGEGRHYGEWFGKGIQSGYGLDEKRFALFNVKKWYDPRNFEGPEENDAKFLEVFPTAQPVPDLPTLTVVPVIGVIYGQDLNAAVEESLHILESEGSIIAPGFADPEGIVVWHDAASTYFKVTLKNDEQPKSKVAAK